MISIIFMLFGLLAQEEISFKPKDEFEIKFEFEFKHRGISDDKKMIHLGEVTDEGKKRASSTPLPFLNLRIKLLKVQPLEVKFKVIKDNLYSIMTKKVEEGKEFQLVLGFTDDIKDKVSGYKHDIQFLSADKKVLSQIIIEFDQDGNYFVNGEKRGKV